MSHIVTLLANPQEKCLHTQLVEDVLKILKTQVSGEPLWLAKKIACEIPVVPHNSHIQTQLAAQIDAPVDVAVQPAGHRRKKFLAADMDSTIITTESLDALAKHLNLGTKVSRITEQAMRGEIEFAQALNARLELLSGLPLTRLQDISLPLTPGATTLIATMKAHGAYCFLLSGGLAPFVESVAHKAGFDGFSASTPEVVAGRLTGKATPPQKKGELLQQEARQRGIKTHEILAVGDGANDISMLAQAGLAVGFRPKPALQPHIHVCLAHADLTALLYLQGYKQEEFIFPD